MYPPLAYFGASGKSGAHPRNARKPRRFILFPFVCGRLRLTLTIHNASAFARIEISDGLLAPFFPARLRRDDASRRRANHARRARVRFARNEHAGLPVEAKRAGSCAAVKALALVFGAMVDRLQCAAGRRPIMIGQTVGR